MRTGCVPAGVCTRAFSTKNPADLEGTLLVAESRARCTVRSRLTRGGPSSWATARNSSASVVGEIDEVDPLALDASAGRRRDGRGRAAPWRAWSSRSTCSRIVAQELATASSAIQVLVRQQLEEAAEREERCAQLVRRVGDELPPRVLELRARRCRIRSKGGGQLGKRSLPPIDDRLAEVTRSRSDRLPARGRRILRAKIEAAR